MVMQDDFFEDDDNFTGVGFGEVDTGAVVLTDSGVNVIITDTFPRYEERTTKLALQEIFRLSNGTAGSAVDIDALVRSNIGLGGPGVLQSVIIRLQDYGYVQTGSIQ